MGVVLDYVNWYGDEPQKPLLSFANSNPETWNDPHFNAYFSNSVRFVKDFDSGNKYNIVHFRIDRTGSDGDLRPYPKTFQNTIADLGKPLQKTLECVFEGQEKDAWDLASAEIKSRIPADLYCDESFENRLDRIPNDQWVELYTTAVSGYSPKSAFNKVARKNGYRYCSFDNGFYEYRMVNEHAHTFIVELGIIPFSLVCEAFVSAEGYNFSQTFYSAPRVVIRDEAAAQQYAETVFRLARRVVDQYSESLFSLYGQTPKWYVK